MGEGKRETGMKWIDKALLLLLADVLTIAFSYYAALVLRFCRAICGRCRTGSLSQS